MNTDNGSPRFTIQDETADIPDSIYVADAENLRIEKLSTRVTLVTVLIPCLLVIVLAVAYLDIKNRVASTQNTGTIGVQNLSKDLESRFSSLSLKQAKLEEQLADITKRFDTTTAAMQVKLKKAITAMQGDIQNKASRSDMATLAESNETALKVLKKDMTDLNASFADFDEALAGQILLMTQGVKKDRERLVDLEKKVNQLDGEKLTKASMNLALGLERLALQELVKDTVRDVETKLARMDKRIVTLDQQLKSQHKQRPSPSPSPPAEPSAPSAAPAPDPSTAEPDQSTGLEEQTIN